jgi:hypothetical protein
MQHNRQPDERRAGEKAWKKPVHLQKRNIGPSTFNGQPSRQARRVPANRWELSVER